MTTRPVPVTMSGWFGRDHDRELKYTKSEVAGYFDEKKVSSAGNIDNH